MSKGKRKDFADAGLSLGVANVLYLKRLGNLNKHGCFSESKAARLYLSRERSVNRWPTEEKQGNCCSDYTVIIVFLLGIACGIRSGECCASV